MDPYDFHDQEEVIADEDDLERLEKELAPSSADYYGVLNISKKVLFHLFFFFFKKKGSLTLLL